MANIILVLLHIPLMIVALLSIPMGTGVVPWVSFITLVLIIVSAISHGYAYRG